MKFTKEIKIALVSILGIVVLFFGMQFLKGLSLFGNDNSYYVAFVDATGLSQSAPVYANGYRVGVVKSLEYDYSPQGKITAVVGLDKQMRVPRGSRAELASDLLGNIKVNLVLSDDPINMLAPGDTIQGSQETGLMSKVGEIMPVLMKRPICFPLLLFMLLTYVWCYTTPYSPVTKRIRFQDPMLSRM